MKIENVPKDQSITVPLEPRVRLSSGLQCGDVKIPMQFEKKFLRRLGICDVAPLCGLEKEIENRIQNKSFALRGIPQDGQVDWFGLVSYKFAALPASKINERVEGKFECAPEVKYTKNQGVELSYRLPFSMPGDERFSFFVDTGEYGIHGGNGESALKYGLVLSESLRFVKKGSVIHRKVGSLELLDTAAENIDGFVEDVKEAIDESKHYTISPASAREYLARHSARLGTELVDFGAGFGKTTTPHNVAERLVCLAKEYAPNTRKSAEYVAGELILYHKELFKLALFPFAQAQ